MFRILLVEDNPIEASELAFLLGDSGFQVQAVGDAEQALAQLATETFDLILSDLQLPGQNGFDLCRKIKNSSERGSIPVVLATRWTNPINVLRGLEAGADGFLSKGQKPEEIVERINRILCRNKQKQVGGDSGTKRVVFLESEFTLPADRDQILEGLLAGFDNVVYLNDQYEREVERRKGLQETLQDSQAFYQSLVETLPAAIMRKDLQGRFTFANKQFCALLGKPLEVILNKTDFDFFPTDLAEKYANDDRQVVDSEQVFEDIEEHRRPDGQVYYVQVLKSPVHNARGDVVGTQGIFWDVSERKRAEEDLRRTAMELARSNAELARFATVASHDLQEPLRTVASYLELLANRYSSQLDDKARRWINYVVDGVARMKQLITDLLEYARVTTRGNPFADTDVGAVVNQCLANMHQSMEECGAVIRCGSFPRVKADATQLLQLFQNLISNSLKYRGPRKPEIHVEAKREGDGWLFSVRDNGLGIAPEFYERIFQIFQRLHASSEYPGTGIGLALCQKIVERHGGHIWVESKPDQGSVFYFTLPLG